MVDCFAADNFYLCPPTFLLPMSPAAQPTTGTRPHPVKVHSAIKFVNYMDWYGE